MENANAAKPGMLALKDLIEYAGSHRDCYVPPRSGASLREMGQFGSLCRRLTEIVPDERGVYLWGYYDPRGLWHNTYLGLALKGKIVSCEAG